MYEPGVSIDLSLTETGLLLKCSPREKDDAKKIPGARARGLDWLLPLSWSSCLAARHIFGDRLVVLPGANEWAGRYLAWRTTVEVARGAFKPSGLDERLKPHQESGSEWLSVVGRALLADEMRVGKTPQTIVAARKMDLAGLNPWPVLCIVPNTIRKDWAEAWADWSGASAPTVAVVAGTPAQRRKAIASGADVVIASWDAIRTLSRVEKYGSIELSEKEKTDGPLNEVPWRLVVADEVHRAADPHSKWTRAWWYLSHSAPYSFGLTGTPVKQNLADTQSIMFGLVPEEYAVRTTWFNLFCLTRQGEHAFEVMGLNPQTEHIFHEVLGPRMERRLLETVAPDMPKALPPVIREVEMGTVQTTAYKQMKKHFMAEVDGELLVAGNDLTVRTRLNQIAAGTPVVDEEGGVTALKMPSCKVEAMMDQLGASGSDPLVVFSSSRLLINLCAKELVDKKIPFVAIVGDPQTAEERDAAKERFQAGRARVCLCTYGAGAEGIDLSRADVTLRLDPSDRMIWNQQAPARVTHLTKTRPTQDILVLAEGTLEYAIHKKSGEGGVKEGYLQEVVRDHLRK